MSILGKTFVLTEVRTLHRLANNYICSTVFFLLCIRNIALVMTVVAAVVVVDAGQLAILFLMQFPLIPWIPPKTENYSCCS